MKMFRSTPGGTGNAYSFSLIETLQQITHFRVISPLLEYNKYDMPLFPASGNMILNGSINLRYFAEAEMSRGSSPGGAVPLNPCII